VDEDLVADVLVHGAAGLDEVAKAYAIGLIVLGLCVDDVDEGAALLNGLDILGVALFQIIGPRVVLDGKLDVGVVVNL